MDKAVIIAEIRRLAAEFGGKAPGSRQFYSLTQTRESTWKGKHWNTWNNWGDALEEAGFTRAEPKVKFDSEHVLKQLALLTKKCQKFPVMLDMRREKRVNPDFPNDKAISSSFGSREQALTALVEFCASNEQFVGLVPILRESSVKTGFQALKSSDGDLSSPTTRDDQKISGYVYLFKSEKKYKIGSSRAPYRRIGELINQSAFGGKPIHMIATDDPEGIERYWHKRFESARIIGVNKSSGEWFLLSPSDVAAFKSRKTM
jgi:hypothetical protein